MQLFKVNSLSKSCFIDQISLNIEQGFDNCHLYPSTKHKVW